MEQSDALSGQARVLHFPTERSVGTLTRTVETPSGNIVEELGECQGDLVVPAGGRLHLFWADNLTDLTPIAQLNPDDFYSFHFPIGGWARMTSCSM